MNVAELRAVLSEVPANSAIELHVGAAIGRLVDAKRSLNTCLLIGREPFELGLSVVDLRVLLTEFPAETAVDMRCEDQVASLVSAKPTQRGWKSAERGDAARREFLQGLSTTVLLLDRDGDARDHTPVECPVLGFISREDCAAHQARPSGAVSPPYLPQPLRVRDFYACRDRCPHSRFSQGRTAQ